MSSSAHSRRSLLKGIGAGAVVAGWSAATGAWVTSNDAAAATSELSYTPVPPLDGTLTATPGVLDEFSKDWGGFITARPQAVLRTGSVQDVVKIINYARANRLKVAVNGRSGQAPDLESHSFYGNALTAGGISIDGKGFDKIHSITSSCAVVGGGVSLHDLAAATLDRGLIVPSQTDYIRLSVGGVASVGGFGGTVHKFGLFSDTIDEIEVVTGDGRVLTASATNRPDLFNAVLNGCGQVAVITKAKVRLMPAPSTIRVYTLNYNSLAVWQADQEFLMRDGRFVHQSGGFTPKPDGSGYWYQIEAGFHYSAPAKSNSTVPNDAALLAGLHDERATLAQFDAPFRDFVNRVDPYEQAWKEQGLWSTPHPWLNMVVPASKIQSFVSSVLAELPFDGLGGGFSIMAPFPTARVKHPLFARPNEPVAYLVDLLRMPLPGDSTVPAQLAQNRRFYDRLVAAGGKRYVIGAIPGMTPADWKRHFGPAWDFLVAAKQRYDPDRILSPGWGFFA